MFVLLLGATALAACERRGPEVVIHTRTGTVSVDVEVARTPDETARGLMYRRELADGRGMLFLFPREEEHSFWMKNTFIPLDMVFIASDRRIVGIHADATPLSTNPISVGVPSRWVLEVPGGFASRRGIATGDRVDLPPVATP